MEYRVLGSSGFSVPVLSFGTGTFGGNHPFFSKWGASDVAEATRLVDLCLEAGANMFDTADVYSFGQSEEILGEAVKGRRDKVLLGTKATFGMSDDPNDVGSSRFHLIRSCEQSLRRLQTDYVDIYTIHGFDARTPVEETMRALDDAGAERQGALPRLLQFFRLAPDEVAGGLRALRLVALRRPPGALLAPAPRATSGS